ncbi:MAG: zinc finger MYND domain-containing protein, partial [Halobacteriaceae archaeon]
MDDSTDALGFCLDYERRDVAKHVFGPMPSVCLRCGDQEKKLRSCGACRVARYCSVDCQMHDWPTHKLACDHLKGERDRGLCLQRFSFVHGTLPFIHILN